MHLEETSKKNQQNHKETPENNKDEIKQMQKHQIIDLLEYVIDDGNVNRTLLYHHVRMVFSMVFFYLDVFAYK